MKYTTKLSQFFRKPFFSDYRTLFGLWALLAIIASVMKFHRCNNFQIFRHVYYHVIEQLNLYIPYPEYHDVNYYGPVFSLLVAPFAIPPVPVGLLLWDVVLILVLYWSIRKLPLERWQHIFIFWFCAHELLTALFMSQFNIAIAAIIVGSFYCIEKEKDGWAAFLIILGTFVKLYGIVGLAFFFFSKHKMKFILYLLLWSGIMFVAPMAISSPDYIVSQYVAWFDSLANKNLDNMFSIRTNVSLLGLVRKISHSTTYSDLWLIAGGIIMFGLTYLRVGQFKYKAYRYTLLASVLLFVVLFSTGTESSTYIIGLVGVAIWYLVAPWKRSKLDIGLMVFAFILTSLSPSDLFPAYIRNTYVLPYALKALPCVLIWFKLLWEMYSRDYYAPATEWR